MKERLIGGRLVGVTWRWHSKRRRLLHRLAVRLGVIAPPVHRVSALAEAMHDLAMGFERQLLRMMRLPPLAFKPGRRMEWKVRDAAYEPFATTGGGAFLRCRENHPPSPPPPPSC